MHQEYNLKLHYSTKHVEEFAKHQGNEGAYQVAHLKKSTTNQQQKRQQNVFDKTTKVNNAAVKASYVSYIHRRQICKENAY